MFDQIYQIKFVWLSFTMREQNNRQTNGRTSGQTDRQCGVHLISSKSLSFIPKRFRNKSVWIWLRFNIHCTLNDLQYIWILFKSFLTVTCHDNKYQVYSIFLILKNAWLWIIGSDNKSAHTVTPGKPLGEGRGNNFRKILVTKTLWTTIYRLHTLLKHYKVIKLDILVKEAVLLFILDTWVSMWNI